MIDINDILERIEETDNSRVDKCVMYSEIVLFLQSWINSFEVRDTGNKIHNVLLNRIITEINSQVSDLQDKVKNFIALNLIK